MLVGMGQLHRTEQRDAGDVEAECEDGKRRIVRERKYGDLWANGGVEREEGNRRSFRGGKKVLLVVHCHE
jgi:hypothetical protein